VRSRRRSSRAVACALAAACALGAPACGEAPGTDAPDVIGPCPDIYAQELVPTFELDFAPADWAALHADHAARVKGNYYPATFRLGDERVPAVYVRLRGRTSNWVGTKLQLTISFNHVDRDARFHGLRKIVLDASAYDHSLLRERVGLAFLRDAGVPAPCANNARLMVNGTYEGLYSSFENADREYLERIFSRPEGDLFAIDGETGMWELETNEDESNLDRLDAFLATSDLAGVAVMADLDASVVEWAGEAMVPHAEGYLAGVGNYQLYDHPARGFVTLPYDLDSAFFFDDVAGTDLHTADPLAFTFPGFERPRQLQLVLADETWRRRFVDELRGARAAYDVASMQARVDTWAAQIAGDVVADPNRGFTDEQHAAAVAEIRTFVAARAEFMDGWLAAR